MARRHPEPTGELALPTYRDLDPILGVGGIGDYYGVSKGLAAKWARGADFPEPIAQPRSGALYRTADVIAWGVAHERKRGEGPRAAGDPRPPSVAKTARKLPRRPA